MALGRSPLGGLLELGDGLANDCCCSKCCCPGMTLDGPSTTGTHLVWSVTSTCGLTGDLEQDYSTAGDCIDAPADATYFTSVMRTLGLCNGVPIPARFHLRCVPSKKTADLCGKYELTVDWGNSGCSDAQRGPWEAELGCECDPFHLVFIIPCPRGTALSCRCAAGGLMTVVVTKAP